MRTTSITLTVLVFAFISLNIYWYAKTQGLSNKINYHATHNCELQQFSLLVSKVPIGTSIDQLNEICSTTFIKCNMQSNQILFNFAQDCPSSGRPYCGFVIQTHDGKVKNIQSGYPCH
jgi:hypothetical protein